MSGGKSLKRDDYLALAALAGIGAATGGFGLLGSPAAAGAAGATATGAAGSAGAVAGDAFLPGLLAGATSAGEAGALTAGAAGAGSAVAGDAFLPGLVAEAPEAQAAMKSAGLLGKLNKLGKGAAMAQMAGGGEQLQPQMSPPPMGQTIPAGATAPPLADLWPAQVIDPEKRRRMMAMYGGRYA